MIAFVNAFLWVVVGEMGDKTQLLAMAMASKYKARYVMIGIFVATVLNHALAVLVGSYLGAILPMDIICIAASLSFILFGLWTIRGDENPEENKPKVSRYGPILTVAIAFFLAEMGDKTQLMTVALAVKYRQPLWTLMGTTAGMLVADGIGVLFGAWIRQHIPEVYIKWGAGIAFMLFGTLTLYNNVPSWMLTPVYIALYLLLLGGLIYLIGIKLASRAKQPCEPKSQSRRETA